MSKISVNTIEDLAASKTISVSTIATSSDISAAISSHASLADPHPTYATNTEVTTLIGSTAPASHVHTISNVTNLQTTLDGKAASSHTHTLEQLDVSRLRTRLLISTTVLLNTPNTLTTLGTQYIYKGGEVNGYVITAVLPSTVGNQPGDIIRVTNGANYYCRLVVQQATVYQTIVRGSDYGQYLSEVSLTPGQSITLVVSSTTSSGYYVWDLVEDVDKYDTSWVAGIPATNNNTFVTIPDGRPVLNCKLMFKRNSLSPGTSYTTNTVIEYVFAADGYSAAYPPTGGVALVPWSGLGSSTPSIMSPNGVWTPIDPTLWDYRVTAYF